MIKCIPPKRHKPKYTPVNNRKLLLRFSSSDILWMYRLYEVVTRVLEKFLTQAR
jgi:hypothetical protein